MLLIVGIGIEEKDLTLEAIEALKNAEIVYASKNVIEKVRKVTKAEVREIKSFSKEFYQSICEEAKSLDIAVVSTGDPMVSGLGTKFPCDARIISGISSVQKALAKLKKDLCDFVVISAHGRKLEDCEELLKFRNLMILADKNFEISKFKGKRVTVLENLGMDGEKIVEGWAEEVEIRSDYAIVCVWR